MVVPAKAGTQSLIPSCVTRNVLPRKADDITPLQIGALHSACFHTYGVRGKAIGTQGQVPEDHPHYRPTIVESPSNADSQ